jgi:hypothetical protein
MSLRIEYGILLVAEEHSIDECLAIMRKGNVQTVYINTTNRNLEDVVKQANEIYDQISNELNLFEPVIIGSLSIESLCKINKTFGDRNLNTTPLSFDEFVADMQ